MLFVPCSLYQSQGSSLKGEYKREWTMARMPIPPGDIINNELKELSTSPRQAIEIIDVPQNRLSLAANATSDPIFQYIG